MKTGDLSSLSPSYVRDIAPYVAGKPTSEVARELRLEEASIIKLASNENPRGPSALARAAINAAMTDLTRYPDSNGFALKAALATKLGVAPEQLVLGNGSNDVLELVTQAFLRPSDEAVYSQYAFVVYPLATQARGARGIVVPARDFGHDPEAMAAAITDRTRIVFLANPNNPTGTWLRPSVLAAFIERVPENVLIVLDEAYYEYLAPEERADSIKWIDSHPNLIVSRTFSKAYGLAALRVGFGVMNAQVAEMLNRVRQPFNVNALAQVAALAALQDEAYLAESFAQNKSGMAQLEQGFRNAGVAFVRSHGNFVLVHVSNGAAVNQRLLEQGVIVRPVANYGLPEHLRITVGLQAENARLLRALSVALKNA